MMDVRGTNGESGSRGAGVASLVFMLSLSPGWFIFCLVCIEQDTYDVPGPVLDVRYRIMNKIQDLCLCRELALRTANMCAALP